MSTEQLTTSVTIMDKEYRITCPASQQDALIQAANYLDQKMRTIRDSGKVVGADRIAVMAALNITHERLATDLENKSMENETKQQTQKVEHLTMQLESALAQHV